MADNSSNYPVLSSSSLKNTTVGEYVSYSDENVPVILEEISDSLSKNEFKGITGIDVTNTANIELVYDNRIAVIIGLPEDIDYKIRTAMAIITESLTLTKQVQFTVLLMFLLAVRQRHQDLILTKQ